MTNIRTYHLPANERMPQSRLTQQLTLSTCAIINLCNYNEFNAHDLWDMGLEFDWLLSLSIMCFYIYVMFLWQCFANYGCCYSCFVNTLNRTFLLICPENLFYSFALILLILFCFKKPGRKDTLDCKLYWYPMFYTPFFIR